MKKLLVLFLISSITGCQSQSLVIDSNNIDTATYINSTVDINKYYPVENAHKWNYSLEQFQNETPSTKFTNMEISIISNIEKDGYKEAVLNRFYPESNVQPYKTLVKKYPDRIELSRYMQKEVFKEFSKAGNDYITVLQSPLTINKTWEGRVFQGGTEMIKVVGFENVTVPAGKFKALKINHNIKYNNGKEDNLYYWYADGVGMIKMYEEITLVYSSGQSTKFKSIGSLTGFSKK